MSLLCGSSPRRLLSVQTLLSDWARYNLLYAKVFRRETPFIRQSWRDKYARMADLIKVTVRERFDVVLTEAQVNRIRRLVVPSLRRGRHDLTLNTILNGSDTAKDFLIGFITKRMELKKGPGAPLSYWEQYWSRTDRLAEFVRGRTLNSQDIPQLLPPTKMNVGPADAVTNIGPHPTEAKPQGVVLTNQEIVAAVGRWLAEYVESDFHREICDQARYRVIRYPSECCRPMVSTSLSDLIQEARPLIEGRFSDDYTSGHVDWLLAWMLALRSDIEFIWKAIAWGYDWTLRSAA